MGKKKTYDVIKRQNGEAFARAIRDYNERIFEIENLPKILRYAGRNPLPLLKFLNGMLTVEKSHQSDEKDPFVLLEKAGYKAFYADSLEKQNSIKPYFAKGEALCTFIDKNRYKNYYIVHCVHALADTLKREDFLNKEQQGDRYGVSVISIQILKTGGFIKITNRYNHTVDGCDNTFNSNPDNIIAGLTEALKTYFKVDFDVRQEPLPNGFIFQSGCLYHYNQEINNCYIGSDFYLRDGKVYPIDKNSQMMVDEFIIDLKEKKILNPAGSTSPLYEVLQNEVKEGSVWQISKRLKRYIFSVDRRDILEIHDSHMVALYLRKTTHLDNFLNHHKYIESFYGYSVISLGDKTLSYTPALNYTLLPRCEKIGKNCFERTKTFIEAPLLKKEGIYFYAGFGVDVNKKEFVSQGIMPYQIYEFLKRNLHTVNNLNFTELTRAATIHADNKPFLYFKDDKFVGLYFPEGIKVLEKCVLMDLPDLREVTGDGIHLMEDGNLLRCHMLEKAKFNKLRYIGCNCVAYCRLLEELSFPELVKVPSCTSVCNNSSLRYVYAPNLYVVPDFTGLPVLERFDSKKGVYIREQPCHISNNRFSNKFVLLKREGHEKR